MWRAIPLRVAHNAAAAPYVGQCLIPDEGWKRESGLLREDPLRLRADSL